MTETLIPARRVSFRPSALDVYRDSRRQGAPELAPHFATGFMEVASGLQAAESVEPADRELVVARWENRARGLLRPGFPAEFWGDPIGCQSPTGSLRSLSFDAVRMGHPFLARHLIESLSALYPLESLEGGRILKEAIFISNVAGADVRMEARVVRLLRIARHLHNEELLFAGWRTFASAAQIRGNHPRLERASRRALQIAIDLDDERLLSVAYDLRAVVLGSRRELGGALVYHWKAISGKCHPAFHPAVLANTAETLYRSGLYRAARAARAQAITEGLPLGNLSASLGGYAAACAALRDVQGVQWACRQVQSLADIIPRGRGVAQGLLGCADACGEVGLTDLARALYAKGIAIADAGGYHDLRFRTDPAARREAVPAVQLDEAATTAVESIEGLAPDGISLDLIPARV